jgi:hypothetical protein
MTRLRPVPFGCLGALCASLLATSASADTVVQIPLPELLDARSVTTLTGGTLVVFDLPTDGGGLQNAFATKAVALMQNTPPENCLPDDGFFPETARHPDVQLNFSNAAEATAPQTHLVLPTDAFGFDVPQATYSKLFLFFNGAAGGTTVHITLGYADDSTQTEDATVPDYYADIDANDPVIFNLATDLAKWNMSTQINEANHHNITGVELSPTPTSLLTRVDITRELEGNLVFWGATGIATSDVAGAGAGGAAAAAGAAGADAGGAAGAGGAGGAAGEGGTPTSAGVGGEAGSAGAAGSDSAGAGGTPVAAAGSVGNAGSSAAPTSSPASSDSGGCAVGGAHAPALGHLALLSLVALRRRRRN